MSAPLLHKRRVRVDTDLPEPATTRRAGVPIVALGLVAWGIAVLAGVLLLHPDTASGWNRWARDRWNTVVAPALETGTAPGQSTKSSTVDPELTQNEDGPAQGGAGFRVRDLVVQEQGAGGAAPRPAPSAPMTCEGAIRAYRESVLAGDAGPPRPIREDTYQLALQNGIYLRACDVSDGFGVDVCAAIRHGRIVGVTVQTSPHSASVERCLARAVRTVKLEGSSDELDVSHARFEPRWR